MRKTGTVFAEIIVFLRPERSRFKKTEKTQRVCFPHGAKMRHAGGSVIVLPYQIGLSGAERAG